MTKVKGGGRVRDGSGIIPVKKAGSASDQHNDPLVRAAEAYIPHEIAEHLSGLTVYAQLRAGHDIERVIVNDSVEASADAESSSCRPKINKAAAFSCVTRRKRNRGIEDARSWNVHLKSCVSRVLSSQACCVLHGCHVLFVKSALIIHAVAPLKPGVSRSQPLRRGGSTDERTNNLIPSESEAEANRTHSVTLLTLHIVDDRVYKNPGEYAFVLQSVCQPGLNLQLECYTYYMLHFGLLMHFLWQCPTEAFTVAKRQYNAGRKVKLRRTQSGATPAGGPDGEAKFFHSDRCYGRGMPLHLHLAQTATAGGKGPSVLVLGLGGNVIGNWMDEVFPPNVCVDIVEVEPAVLHTCLRHMQVPPCEEERGTANTATGVWCVTRGHQRHPNYRFILGDARDVLQDGKDGDGPGRSRKSRINPFYDVVILDCYDPGSQSMIHDVGLVDLCRARLVPGGALIVNAHIIPDRETLQEQFLDRSFATVQVLRLSYWKQSAVVCLLSHSEASGEKNCEVETDVLRGRFTVLSADRATKYFHDVVRANPGTYVHKPGACYLDSSWLTSSAELESATCFVKLWNHSH